MPNQSLRQRAAGQQPGNDVQRQNEGPTLRQQIQQMESQFALAMPRGAEAAQLVRDAITCLQATPKLAECEPRSVLGALMTCAQLGLRPGVLGHAWVLPFYDHKSRGQKAQLVIGYQGLVELAHRSGRIQSLIARTVRANDTFDVDYGLADNLIHKPALRGDRGEPIAYYAIVKLVTGGHAFYVMTHEEMGAYRDRYAMAKNREGQIVGPWRDNFEGMAHKTVTRQLAKWMPKSTEVQQAIQADNSIRFDVTPDAEPAAVSYHYGTEDQDPVVDVTEAEVLADEVPVQAPGAPVEPPTEQQVPRAPRNKIQRLQILLRGALKDDREERLLWVEQQIGRGIESTNDLSVGEVDVCIALAENLPPRSRPAATEEPPAEEDR